MDKEIIRMQMTDLNDAILSDLKKDLADEKSKLIGERNENYISELEDMIAQTEEEIFNESQARSLNKSLKMLDEYRPSRNIKLFKYISVVAAALIVVLGLNTASIKVFGQNMFSAAYRLTQGGITISTDDSSKYTEFVVSPSDPYGMKAKCAEYGFFPDVPSYIPSGFVLNNISEDSDTSSDVIIFMYSRDNIRLNFYYTNYKTDNEIGYVSLPTDTYNIAEKEVNGNTVHILEEDKQFTATFIKNKIRYMIFAENLDYEECDKILDSLS